MDFDENTPDKKHLYLKIWATMPFGSSLNPQP